MEKLIFIFLVGIQCMYAQEIRKSSPLQDSIYFRMNNLSQQVHSEFIGNNKTVVYFADISPCNNDTGKLCPACLQAEREQFAFSQNIKGKKVYSGFSLSVVHNQFEKSLITLEFFRNKKIWYMKKYYSLFVYFEGSFLPDFQKADETFTVELTSLVDINQIEIMLNYYFTKKQKFKRFNLN